MSGPNSPRQNSMDPRPSKITSDLAIASRRSRLPKPGISDEIVGRSSLKLDNIVRDNPLYHNAVGHRNPYIPETTWIYSQPNPAPVEPGYSSPNSGYVTNDLLPHWYTANDGPWSPTDEPRANPKHTPDYASSLYINNGNPLEQNTAPLICPTCHETVKTQSDLKKHNLRHNKPFLCGVVGCTRTEGFSTNSDLERHLKSKHPQINPTETRYRCLVPGCKSKDKRWLRQDNFRSHLKRVHSLQYDDVMDLVSRGFLAEKSLSPNHASSSDLTLTASPAIALSDQLPFQSPRPSADYDWDLKSVASINTFRDSALGSSNSSGVSMSAANGLPRTAQEEVLVILNSDSQLALLLKMAAARITKPRFVRNVERLLKMFYRDLRANAVDSREKDAVTIVERHASWLASRLFDVCNPENDSNKETMAAFLDQRVDKRSLLEQYLASTLQSNDTKGNSHQTQAETEYEHDLEDEKSLADQCSSFDGDYGDSNNIDYSRFPNLDHIRKFLIGGTAFENLRRNTSEFVHPKNFLQQASLQQEISLDARAEDTISQVSRRTTPSRGTTDITMPDINIESDDDDAELSSNPDLDDEVVQEDRIQNPRAYFQRLENLEQEIWGNSGVAAYKTGVSVSSADDSLFLLCPKITFTFRAYVNVKQVIPIIKFSESGKLLQLLESYNLMRRIGMNLEKLSNAGFCGSFISLLVKDHDRTEVARLVKITSEAITELGNAFEEVLMGSIFQISLMRVGELTVEVVNKYVQDRDVQAGLTSKCMEMLSNLGLLPHLLINDSKDISWTCITQALDIGLLSYTGAHIQRFDLSLLGRDIDSFKIPRRFNYHNETLQELTTLPCYDNIRLRRRKLQCLDKFLGEMQPWVIHQDFADVGDDRLCLSTTIETLTDLWGPSWKVVSDTDLGYIQEYSIGNGTILPWRPPEKIDGKDFVIHSGEVFCHWVPSKGWNASEVGANQASLTKKYFISSDILLIGASGDFGLLENHNCTPSIRQFSSIKTKLDQQGALRSPNTARSHRYVDSHEVKIQGSALGIVSAVGTVTYKRRSGHTMKDALVERWRNKKRNPVDLEAFSGVEVSLCTGNARRRRLLHLLNSPNMHNYLSGISFQWFSESCEQAYFKALKCPRAFRKFWKENPDYRENVGDAISICLDILEETGIDDNSREMRAIWIEAFDTDGDSDGVSEDESDNDGSYSGSLSGPAPISNALSSFFEEWIVTLFRSEHTWTGFLADSEEALTMAVMTNTCLDFDHHGYGRRCHRRHQYPSTIKHPRCSKGYPVLQTSLHLNKSILSDGDLKQEKVDGGSKISWNASEIKKGTKFYLGDHGTLKVLTSAGETCPVIMEWSGNVSETFQEVKNVAVNERMLGRNPERHHREYIRGTWESKPLPMLVLSKSNKVLFCKD